GDPTTISADQSEPARANRPVQPHEAERRSVRRDSVQEVPNAILISDPAGATAIQRSVIDVAIVRRHENSCSARIEDMVIVESRQRLVLDATRLERGVERKCPQSALTVQIKRFAVRSPVRRLK